MGSITLLALLGVGALAFLFNDDDADVPEVSDPLPPPDPEEPMIEDPIPEGGVITINGLVGVEPNEDGETEVGPGEIEIPYDIFNTIALGDGDDTAELDGTSNVVINGQAGNDTITSTGMYGVINGGAGDDVLIAGAGDSVSGGEGDDTLSLDISDIYSERSGILALGLLTPLAGNLGDDQINVSVDIGDQLPEETANVVFLGEGADTVDLHLQSNLDDAEAETPTQTDTFIVLSDFDSAEDSLIVQIDRGPDGEYRDVLSAEISGSNLIINFSTAGSDELSSAIIRIGDNANVNVEDIVFVNV